MKKVIVLGSSGAGKTVFSKRLHDLTGLPLIYLDLLWHKPDKTDVGRDAFDRLLGETMQRDSWILDGNYLRTVEIRLKACDTVFFLDYPMEVCMEGARSRIGIKREDLPWLETELDEEFKTWIEEFPTVQRPKLIRLLEEYQDKVNVTVFHSREESERYLDNLQTYYK